MLTNSLLKKFITQAHQLKPVVIIGNKGLTATVHHEIDQALLAHELIKVKINAETREERQTMINEILQSHDAQMIQKIGHVLVIYRENQE